MVTTFEFWRRSIAAGAKCYPESKVSQGLLLIMMGSHRQGKAREEGLRHDSSP